MIQKVCSPCGSFSFSFGGKCIIFQSFNETHFQSIIHYQDDTQLLSIYTLRQVRKSLENADKGEFGDKHRVQAITPISIGTFRSGHFSRGIHASLLETTSGEAEGFFQH